MPNVHVARVGRKFSRVVIPDPANRLQNVDKQFNAGVTYGKRGYNIDAQLLQPTQFFTHELPNTMSRDQKDSNGERC